MKINFLFLFFLFNQYYVLINSQCFLTNNTILSCSGSITSCNLSSIKVLSNSPTKINYPLSKNGSSNTIDLSNLSNGFIFLESTGECFINTPVDPYIKSVDSPPTYGGLTNFTGAFLADEFGQSRIVKMLNVILTITYNSDTRLYSFLNFPKGCGKFDLYGPGKDSIYSGNYKPSTVVDFRKDAKLNNIILVGSNLYNPKININGPNFSDQQDITSINENMDSGYFTVKQIRYCGKWTISLTLCDLQVKDTQPIVLNNEPYIDGITSVSAKDGGNVTINGVNLYSRSLDNPDPSGNKNLTGYSITLPYNKKCVVIDYDFTNGTIICSMPPSNDNEQKKNLNFVLTIDQIYTANINFSYDSPSISTVKQTTFPTSGDAQFTINGKYLNDDSIIMVNVKVPTSNGNIIDYNCSIKSQDEDEMVVGVPLNAYPGYITIVSKNVGENIYSNIGDLSLKPIFNSITKSNTNGQIVTISGISVHTEKLSGSKKVNMSVSVYVSDGIDTKVKCKDPISTNGVNITCLMGPGVGKNLSVSVDINGYQNQNSLYFSYNSPVISSLYQNSSGYVTFYGENFGADPSKISIISSDKSQINVLNANDTSLQFLIPETLNGLNYLNINVGSSNHQNVLSNVEYAVKPTILNITSIPASGGQVTITGHHLSERAAISFRSQRGTPSGIPCNNITVSDNNSVLKCEVYGFSGSQIGENGAGERKTTSGTNHPIFMSIKGRNAINPNNITFSFNPPIVYGSPGVNGLDRKTIYVIGENFNRIGLKVYVGDAECKWPVIYHTFDTITCMLEAVDYSQRSQYENKTFDIKVTVDGQTGFIKNNFTYYFDETSYTTESSKLTSIIPAIVICGSIGLVPIISIGIYIINRNRRLKEIQKILDNKVF
uniref:Tgr11238B n=1 Tax=Dictyostelium purpureum TaxID=5786 RepID=A0A3S9KFX8_DICPU|nr:tgr11238B [Dictyostelium purpureum]